MVKPGLLQENEFKKIPNDKLVYRTYVNKFNEMFKDDLREEQKSLLNKFINSFADNGLDLKVFLNEEVARIKNVLNERYPDSNVEFKDVSNKNERLAFTVNFKNDIDILEEN